MNVEGSDFIRNMSVDNCEFFTGGQICENWVQYPDGRGYCGFLPSTNCVDKGVKVHNPVECVVNGRFVEVEF